METDVLSQLIGARHELLVELSQLAGRQPELIRSGDMKGLFSLLAVKQRLLTDLIRIDRHLDPFRDQDPERRQWRSAADRERCQEVARRCEMLLGEITGVERECETELIRRRDGAATALQQMHGALRATQAYGVIQEVPGTQFDASCET